ncbi:MULTISPECIES: DUF1697 domain-containing protein [unclassified Microbacterium]|uniref:DUF1697 domain-containing protein n=1 Tax=unclassified Microbacterium TaxID=2609290 RepID=UPI00214BC4AA|nr:MULTISPECIES: DUF1697 domain-containing protein [unclassified Microbacterium]MCR2808331.1 DUF1697 domain-containing protein [Microbacterium sp. zg.B185]WIM19217.1 DUF1697 domain-containing protein [Microbacterium sp. zg-B185]
MPTYLAFLRAINLGATRQFPKDRIRRAVESIGFDDVETHINTGNVRFSSRMRSIPRIETALEAAFRRDRGFEVPTIVFGLDEFRAVAADAHSLPVDHAGATRHYVELLRTALTPAVAAQLEAATTQDVHVVVRGRAVHTFLSATAPLGGAATTKFAKQLGVSTNRNATVIRAIAQRWC